MKFRLIRGDYYTIEFTSIKSRGGIFRWIACYLLIIPVLTLWAEIHPSSLRKHAEDQGDGDDTVRLMDTRE